MTSSTYLGAGLAPAGSSLAGYGSPSTTVSINKTILIDDFGRNGNVRLIDPVTMDYKFNSKGCLVGGDGIQQMVYLALLTVKNSSALSNFGQSFTNIKVIGEHYVTLVTNEVNQALKKLIDSKKISLLNVDVKRIGPNKSKIDIRWRNLTTNTDQINTI